MIWNKVEAGEMEKLNDLHGKVVMVTAATGGIGQVTATELAKLGARVVVIGRDPQRGRTALDDIRAQSSNPNVDLLNFDDLQSRQRYQPPYAYCRAKLANVMFTYELSRRLAGTGVTANCADPGMADTPGTRASSVETVSPLTVLIGWLAPIARALSSTPTIEKAAWSSVYLAASPDVEGVTGQYYSPRATAVKSSKASYDLEAARRLWKVSEALVALHLKPEPMAA